GGPRRAHAAAALCAQARVADDRAVRDIQAATIVATTVDTSAAPLGTIATHGARPDLQVCEVVVENASSGKGSAEAAVVGDRAVRDRHPAVVSDAGAVPAASAHVALDGAAEHGGERLDSVDDAATVVRVVPVYH